MKTFTAKTLAAALAGTMALAFASCSLIPGADGGAKTEDIVDAADSFAKALVSCDADKIAKLTTGSDAADVCEEIFGGSDVEYTDEQLAIADAVADTIGYEIDEDSVKIDKDEASVDVTFTMADYEAVLEGEFADVDEAVAAIKDCDDTCEVEVTFEFAEDDDEWLVSNLSDKAYDKLYGFYGLDVSFAPALEDLISDEFIAADYGYLYMTVTFSEDISDYLEGITYDIYFDGELVYGNQTPYSDGEQVWGSMSIDGPLENGTYTVIFYYNGTEFASGSIDVDNSSGGQFYTDGNDYLCSVEFGEDLESLLQDNGYDVNLDGELYIDFVLTLGEDGDYEITVDKVNFESNLEDYLYANMDDQNMMVFAGVSSMDDLEATAAEMNTDVDGLRDLLIASMVSSTLDNLAGATDQGTYTVDGDTISFDSSLMSDFDGTIGDGGMISFAHEYFSTTPGYVLEFYPEG